MSGLAHTRSSYAHRACLPRRWFSNQVRTQWNLHNLAGLRICSPTCHLFRVVSADSSSPSACWGGRTFACSARPLKDHHALQTRHCYFHALITAKSSRKNHFQTRLEAKSSCRPLLCHVISDARLSLKGEAYLLPSAESCMWACLC